MIEKYFVKVGSLKYNLAFFWTNFVISFKASIEYKVNFYMTLLNGLAFIPTLLLFGYVLYSVILNQFSWTIVEYVLFIFLIDLYMDITGYFHAGKSLENLIKSGDLNMYLTKPTNPFISYAFAKSFNTALFILITIMSYSIILLILDFRTTVLDLLLGVFLFIVLCLIGALFYQFLISFTWFILESDFFFRDLKWRIEYEVLGRYPALFFEKWNFLFLIMIFPSYYISSWLISIISFSQVSIEYFEIIILVSITFISILGIIINWKYGLKRYEAFGG